MPIKWFYECTSALLTPNSVIHDLRCQVNDFDRTLRQLIIKKIGININNNYCSKNTNIKLLHKKCVEIMSRLFKIYQEFKSNETYENNKEVEYAETDKYLLENKPEKLFDEVDMCKFNTIFNTFCQQKNEKVKELKIFGFDNNNTQDCEPVMDDDNLNYIDDNTLTYIPLSSQKYGDNIQDIIKINIKKEDIKDIEINTSFKEHTFLRDSTGYKQFLNEQMNEYKNEFAYLNIR